MIVFGVVLIVLGFVLAALVPAFAYAHLVVVIGIILLVVGVALMLIGRIGRAVGGRRHYDRANQLDPASQTSTTPQLSMSKKYAGFAVTTVIAAGLGLAGLGAPTDQWCVGDFPDNGWVGVLDESGCHNILQEPGPDRGGDGDRGPDGGGRVPPGDPAPGGH
jgi:hypothetical protein